MSGKEPVLEPFLRKAKQMGILDRILFGTDQMAWHDAIGIAIERINSLDFLTVEEKAANLVMLNKNSLDDIASCQLFSCQQNIEL